MLNSKKKFHLKNYLLTDEFSDEGLQNINLNIKKDKKNSNESVLINTDDSKCFKSIKKKDKNKYLSYIDKKCTDELNKRSFKNSLNENNVNNKKIKKTSNKESNIEFIIIEGEDNEKKILINLELKLNDSTDGIQILKIDFEIDEEIYMELIKELLK